jgi:hypothetical protein
MLEIVVTGKKLLIYINKHKSIKRLLISMLKLVTWIRSCKYVITWTRQRTELK